MFIDIHGINKSIQAPHTVIMVRPHNFHPNPMSAQDNGFQKKPSHDDYDEIAKSAYKEVSQAAAILEALGITVHIFEDTGSKTPDSVFPNNWFSTHDDGKIVTYPMFVPNRRNERRKDIIAVLKSNYEVHKIIDYSAMERQNIFLEGTGAMVLDHAKRIAYAARSKRANPSAFQQFCTDLSYQPIMFDAQDKHGTAVYHTNVMMCIANDFALIAPDMLPDEKERKEVLASLENSGKEIITLSEEQIFQFAGNAIELTGTNGPNLILSQTSYEALHNDQLERISAHAHLQPIDVKTIEMAGGSIRCMIAAIHLRAR